MHMRAYLKLAVLAFAGVFCSGCTICPPGFIDDYATVGGKWERADPTTGRVGSILSDPGTTVGLVSNSAEGTYYDDDFLVPEPTGDAYEYSDSQEVSIREDAPVNEAGVIILGDQW